MLQKISTILLAALLLTSCGVTLTRDRSVGVFYSSFEKYPDMWISPNDCPVQHTVLGHLTVEVRPAILPPERTGDGVYTENVNTLHFERIGYDELLEMAVTEARARGADGISNFKITTDRSDGTITAYYVEGLLIRRE